jgi:hypothetical protein
MSEPKSISGFAQQMVQAHVCATTFFHSAWL